MTPRALLDPSRWDSLEPLGVGRTGQVLRADGLVVKVALPGPEARARLREEVSLAKRLAVLGVSTPRVRATRRDGRALVRDFIEGRHIDTPSVGVLQQVARLLERLAPLEDELQLRFDVSPSNLLLVKGRVVLLDAGRRVAPSVLTAGSIEGLRRQWAAWRRTPRRVRLDPYVPPPSGRFHVDTPLGHDPKARLLWKNAPLMRRLEVSWRDAQLLSLGALSTKAAPTTTQVSTRYVDMLALDRKRGPKGDGRAVLLGRLGDKELSLKGCGPTPLTWKGRQFHEDGFVSFPRALWEVTVADELSRLGFDTPEYLALFSTGHTTKDNTGKRWPAAAGLRVAATHWRLGHLRAWTHRPEQLRVMLRHAGRQLLRHDFDVTTPSHVRAFVEQFARHLGHDAGRTDALQIHGFNPTPGNVRLDGHFIDYSTVRFLPEYLPDWRFLENTYAVRLHRLVWRRLVAMLVSVLTDGGVPAPSRDLALRWYDRAFTDGFFDGLAPFFDVETNDRALRRRFVKLTQRLRDLRRDETVSFPYWKQSMPGARFDVLGRAPEVLSAIARDHRQPWRVMQVDDVEPDARTARLGDEWIRALRSLRRGRSTPGRRWSQVIRPFLEPERLAQLLYTQSSPTQFEQWKRLVSTSNHLPPGRHPGPRAKRLARTLGHVELPRLDGEGVERVVGLTPELLEGVREALDRSLGRALIGCVAHGSRVLDRAQLAKEAASQLKGNDLRVRGAEGVKEFGPVAGWSSDLDLKVFVKRGTKHREQLERSLGEALAALGAWFPFSAHHPPKQRLIETPERHIVRAFRRWNGAERRRQLGKGPIPERQVVLVTPSPSSERARGREAPSSPE